MVQSANDKNDILGMMMGDFFFRLNSNGRIFQGSSFILNTERKQL